MMGYNMWEGIVYRYSVGGRDRDYDPIMELLGYGYVGGPLGWLIKKQRVYQYYVTYTNALSSSSEPVFGLKFHGGLIPPVNILAFYARVVASPFTLMGNCRLAVVVRRGFRPGPEVFPASNYAIVVEEPLVSYEVLYPAVIGGCMRVHRRSFDILASLAKDMALIAMSLNTVGDGKFLEVVEASMLGVFEALVSRARLAEARSSIDFTSSLTTAYVSPGGLSEYAKVYLDSCRKREYRVKECLKIMLSSSSIVRYVFGDVVADESRLLAGNLADFTAKLKAVLGGIVERLANLLDGVQVIVADVTGRWSLIELYTLYMLHMKIGFSQVYLLVTPETVVNIVAIQLLLRDLDLKYPNAIRAGDGFLAELMKSSIYEPGRSESSGGWVSLVASSATDPHIASYIARTTVERAGGGKLAYFMGHPAPASLRAGLEFARTSQAVIVPYPIALYA